MTSHQVVDLLRLALAEEVGLAHAETRVFNCDPSEITAQRISLEILRARPAVVLNDRQASALEKDVIAHMLAGLQLIRATSLVSNALQQAGVEHLVMKGAALGALQQGVSSRGAGDVDVLIEAADIARTAAVLEEIGYASMARVPRFDDGRSWKVLSSLDRETGFSGPSGVVDLHWRVSPQHNLFDSPHVLMERGQLVMVGDGTVPTVSAGDALALACFHAYHDGFIPLRSLVDVHRLIPGAAHHGLPPLSERLQQLVSGVLKLYGELFPGINTAEIHEISSRLPPPLGHVKTVWNRSLRTNRGLSGRKTLAGVWRSFVSERVLDHPAQAPIRFIGKRLFHFPPRTAERHHQSLARSFGSQVIRLARGVAD